MERLFGKRGMGMGLGLLDLLMNLLADGESGPCGGLGEAKSHNCEECRLQGMCPLEYLMRKLKQDQDEVGGADGVKDADLLLADGKIAGQKAQVNHLEGVVTALRERINQMVAVHKAGIERLTSGHKEEVEKLWERINRGQNTISEIRGERQSAMKMISTVQDIILSNGHKRPSQGILTALRKELGMPPLEKTKKVAASAT